MDIDHKHGTLFSPPLWYSKYISTKVVSYPAQTLSREPSVRLAGRKEFRFRGRLSLTAQSTHRELPSLRNLLDWLFPRPRGGLRFLQYSRFRWLAGFDWFYLPTMRRGRDSGVIRAPSYRQSVYTTMHCPRVILYCTVLYLGQGWDGKAIFPK